jgi:hypothetical protein
MTDYAPLLALALTALLAAALLELRRTKELHHGYFGALLCYYGILSGDQLAVFVGLVLLVDDDVQHVYQAICKLLGRPIPNDFTPIHHLGSFVLEQLENLWHSVTRIFHGGPPPVSPA